MIPFDWQYPTRLIFGNGSLAQIGERVREIDGRRVLLVTDAGIVAAGHAARAVYLMEEAGMSVAIFDAVPENPTSETVKVCAEIARSFAPDVLVGLGGGSAIDTAKGANFLYTNGGEMRDYRGHGKASKPMLPLIAIPTTAGTGSEMQSYAVIADAETHQKMACGDPKAAPHLAILDPELTVTCPRRVTACTGIDAIAHAVETAVTWKRNPVSSLFSREAFRLLVPQFEKVLDTPDDVEVRGAMLLGAAFAGMAIENSMLGAAHSAANPLTAHFDVVHGQAVGMMLPYVVGFNAGLPEARRIYAELMGRDRDESKALEELLRQLNVYQEQAGFPVSLATLGVTERDVPLLAAEAASQWTAQFNPRPITEDDFAALYWDAWKGVPPTLRR